MQVKVTVKNPGILEVPKGKKVNDLDIDHFKKLVKKKGYEAVIKALNNLKVWNKSKNKKLSKWASMMMTNLKKEKPTMIKKLLSNRNR